MADLPPGFEVPTPPPGAERRPIAVSFAGWVLAMAGTLTGLGGLVYLGARGSNDDPSLGLALAAFGLAELVTGIAILRLLPSFRSIGMAVAAIGTAIDVVWLVQGSRWQLIALVLHVAVLAVLSSQREAFVRRA
jgi:hypothetical protein